MNFLDRYELVLTDDQSPTFRDHLSDNLETMHHRGGAFSETQLIYGNPLRLCLKAGGRRVLSVGLGLGYNEILTAVESLKREISPQDIHLLSFESEEPLRAAFLQWISGEPLAVYDIILGFFAFDPFKVKQWLLQAYENKSWKLEHSLDEMAFHQKLKGYHCIFYDAFSSKTSPQLWEEKFLNNFFQHFCADRSLVTTYACTGALRRSLKNQNFELILKTGFGGKRMRTMGIRGWDQETNSEFSSL